MFEKAKRAKAESENAQKLENSILEEYEEAIKIGNSKIDTHKSGYKVTLIWEGIGVTGSNITLLDGHTFDEFDAIRFIDVDGSVEEWANEHEISIETINDSINNDTSIGLYGYTDYNVSMSNFTENGFQILINKGHRLKKIYGVNY